MHKAIDDVFAFYITNTSELVKKLDRLKHNCTKDEEAINSLIGIRILEYVGKKVMKDSLIDKMDNLELSKKKPVIRDWKNQSITYLYRVRLSEVELSQAEHATQMKISTK